MINVPLNGLAVEPFTTAPSIVTTSLLLYPCPEAVAVASCADLVRVVTETAAAKSVLPSYGSFCVPLPFTPSVRYAIQTLIRYGSSNKASSSDMRLFRGICFQGYGCFGRAHGRRDGLA